MCVTDRHDMTLAVKVALKPNTTNQPTLSSFGVIALTHYHTMTTFDALEEKAFLKTLWEKKKMLVTSIFFFFHNVFCPMKHNLNVLSNIDLASANAFNLPKILSSVKVLSEQRLVVITALNSILSTGQSSIWARFNGNLEISPMVCNGLHLPLTSHHDCMTPTPALEKERIMNRGCNYTPEFPG